MQQNKISYEEIMGEQQVYELKESTDFEKPIIPDNMYVGSVKRIDETEGKLGKRLRFIWEVDLNNKKYEFARSGNLIFTTNSKLGKDLIALGLLKGQKFDIQGLIGKKARLVIKAEEITKKDGSKVRQSVIKEVWRAD